MNDRELLRLARALPAVSPPRDAKARLLASARQAARPRSTLLGGYLTGAVLALSGAAAFAAGATAHHLYRLSREATAPVAPARPAPMGPPLEAPEAPPPIGRDASPERPVPAPKTAHAKPKAAASRGSLEPAAPADRMAPSEEARGEATQEPPEAHGDAFLEERFLDGWRALKKGADGAAEVAFEDVVDAGGSSALAEEASYHRVVALVRSGSLGRAEAAARRHRERWPSGARTEAVAALVEGSR